MSLEQSWVDAEKRDGQRQARSEWRDVEDAVDAMESPLLKQAKKDLSGVLNLWYSTLNRESSDDGS